MTKTWSVAVGEARRNHEGLARTVADTRGGWLGRLISCQKHVGQPGSTMLQHNHNHFRIFIITLYTQSRKAEVLLQFPQKVSSLHPLCSA